LARSATKPACAGYASYGPFAQADLNNELNEMQVNMLALTALTRLFLPGMAARARGGVLNVASTAAFQPGLGMAVYYASKAFVLSFSEALAYEVRGALPWRNPLGVLRPRQHGAFAVCSRTDDGFSRGRARWLRRAGAWQGGHHSRNAEPAVGYEFAALPTGNRHPRLRPHHSACWQVRVSRIWKR
jgi:short subunit dehydrogenase